jgi:hypothetical protein
MCGERISCGSGDTRSVGRLSCKTRIASRCKHMLMYNTEPWRILLPNFKLRSARRCLSCSSSSGFRHGVELVNQLRETDACRGRMSVIFLWYCLSPRSRGAVSDRAVDDGSWVRAELENRRIRPVVMCKGTDVQP